MQKKAVYNSKYSFKTIESNLAGSPILLFDLRKELNANHSLLINHQDWHFTARTASQKSFHFSSFREQNYTLVMSNALPKGLPCQAGHGKVPRTLWSTVIIPAVPSFCAPEAKQPAGGNLGSVFKGFVTHCDLKMQHNCLLIVCIFHFFEHFLFIFISHWASSARCSSVPNSLLIC